MKTTKFTRESGFTLLELLLVIGVAALLLIGGIATYRLVSDGNKTTESTRLLLTIRQEAAVMAQQSNSYDGVTYTTAGTAATTDANGGGSPLVVGGVLRVGQRNPFNGDITIEPNTTDNTQLDVTFDNVSTSACIKLVQAITNPTEVLSIGVGPSGGTPTDLGAIPPTVAQVSTACAGAGTVARIVWTLP